MGWGEKSALEDEPGDSLGMRAGLLAGFAVKPLITTLMRHTAVMLVMMAMSTITTAPM